MSRSEKFTRLGIKDWPRLQLLYKEEWPKYIVPYYLIQNYISWHAKDEAYVDENVQLVCLDNDWSDGTFLLLVSAFRCHCQLINFIVCWLSGKKLFVLLYAKQVFTSIGRTFGFFGPYKTL